MLTWLRLARGVLDLPEADRLYGELAKLLELLRQPSMPSAWLPAPRRPILC